MWDTKNILLSKHQFELINLLNFDDNNSRLILQQWAEKQITNELEALEAVTRDAHELKQPTDSNKILKLLIFPVIIKDSVVFDSQRLRIIWMFCTDTTMPHFFCYNPHMGLKENMFICEKYKENCSDLRAIRVFNYARTAEGRSKLIQGANKANSFIFKEVVRFEGAYSKLIYVDKDTMKPLWMERNNRRVVYSPSDLDSYCDNIEADDYEDLEHIANSALHNYDTVTVQHKLASLYDLLSEEVQAQLSLRILTQLDPEDAKLRASSELPTFYNICTHNVDANIEVSLHLKTVDHYSYIACTRVGTYEGKAKRFAGWNDIQENVPFPFNYTSKKEGHALVNYMIELTLRKIARHVLDGDISEVETEFTNEIKLLRTISGSYVLDTKHYMDNKLAESSDNIKQRLRIDSIFIRRIHGTSKDGKVIRVQVLCPSDLVCQPITLCEETWENKNGVWECIKTEGQESLQGLFTPITNDKATHDMYRDRLAGVITVMSTAAPYGMQLQINDLIGKPLTSICRN